MSEGGAAWHVGQSLGARRRQEDAWHAVASPDGSLRLVVVADGMGGESGGDVASRCAVSRFAEAFASPSSDLGGASVPERLRRALAEANEALLAEIDRNPELEGMGTTLVAVAAEAGEIYHISVGDTLLWKAEPGGLVRINEDHSMRGALQQLVREGRMTAEKAAQHPRRNQLRSVVGDEDLDLVDCPGQPLATESGSMLLIATDGIETLGEDEIHEIVLRADGDARRAVDDLLAAVEARQAPRQDNCTVCAWRIGPAAASGEGGVGRAARRRRSPLLWAALGLLLFAATAAMVIALLGPRLGWGGTETGPPANRAAVPQAPAAGTQASEETPESSGEAETPAPDAAEPAAPPAAPPKPDAPKPDGPPAASPRPDAGEGR